MTTNVNVICSQCGITTRHTCPSSWPPAPAQTPDRPGIDQLTSDGLDALYAELDVRRAWASKAEEAVQYWYDAAVERLARAERAEATLNAVRDELANPLLHTKDPERQGERWLAARIRAALDQHGQTPS